MSVEKTYFDKIAEYGQLVIISGPSGVGKSTVITNYIAEHPNACKCVSVTTRPPRPDEEDGEERHEPGIGINDCAKVSRYLSTWLDKTDFISETYTLEVCSKGFLNEG